MIPYFNTSGACIPGQHFMLPPERRLGRVMDLVEQARYFTLHAGRQTGKTTSAGWLVDHLNASGQYQALLIDLESAREQPDCAVAFAAVYTKLDQWVSSEMPGVELAADRGQWLEEPLNAVRRYLSDLSSRLPKPLVVLFDEADGLVGPAMVSFLTQLRDGYLGRRRFPFPHSVALIGMRQVRDFVLASEDRKVVSWLGTTSPFNITAEAQTLAPFTQPEVEELLLQHTAVTGQRFEAEAVECIFYLSQGHPWLINALADQVVRDVRDRAIPIVRSHVESAKETLILERRTHLDSLLARLREPRIRRIMEPMLLGERLAVDGLDDDLQYVQGLGLIRLHQGRWEIANPIYREVIPRALTFVAQTSLYQETAWYLNPDGTLDLPKLMAAFQKFWRQDGHLAAEGFSYREAGPHLMLMAFLQRIVNGGGRVEREYGLGRGALDLIVEWKTDRQAIEVKLRRDTETEEEALEKILVYLDRLGLTEGWLVMFDLRKTVSWADKIYLRELVVSSKKIHIIGC